MVNHDLDYLRKYTRYILMDYISIILRSEYKFLELSKYDLMMLLHLLLKLTGKNIPYIIKPLDKRKKSDNYGKLK